MNRRKFLSYVGCSCSGFILNSCATAPITERKQLREFLENTDNTTGKEIEKLLKDKWLYYNGKMDRETLEEKGWEPDPFDGLKILKGEMDYYYDSDPEIQKSEEKIQYWKTTIDTLTEIIDNLKWRHQTISNIIKWKQFESGN